MNYRIIPLPLCYYSGDKNIVTYLIDSGQKIIRPFVMWYIEGAKKNILVDTAIEKQDYLEYHPKFKDLEMVEIQSFEKALLKVGLTPSDIDIVILTHLHFDHCYNINKISNAKFMVQDAELEFAHDPAPFNGIYPNKMWYDINFTCINGEHEIEPGISLLPVPGHSAGGQAVLVSTEIGNVTISGMCTCQENFYPEHVHPLIGDDSTILPGILWQAKAAYNSIYKLKNISDKILPLHDPKLLDIESIP